MQEILSVLLITYAVAGEVHESELPMMHAQCLAAERRIATDLKGPRKDRPTVEMVSGRRVPVTSAQCVRACMADGSELALLEE